MSAVIAGSQCKGCGESYYYSFGHPKWFDDVVKYNKPPSEQYLQFEEIRKRLEKIENEVEEIRQSAIASGNEEKQRIKKLGQEEAMRIQNITNEEIDNKVDSAIRNLKKRIAELTIQHFKKDIGSYLDKSKHEKIIEKNIEISGDIIDRE